MESFEMLTKAYEEDCMSHVFEWQKIDSERCESVGWKRTNDLEDLLFKKLRKM